MSKTTKEDFDHLIAEMLSPGEHGVGGLLEGMKNLTELAAEHDAELSKRFGTITEAARELSVYVKQKYGT